MAVVKSQKPEATGRTRSAPATRRERAEATRSRMIEAAAHLFRESGYAATTMSAIAKGSGVAVQTVYFTFHTKTELLSAVADLAITGGTASEPMRTKWAQAAIAEPKTPVGLDLSRQP